MAEVQNPHTNVPSDATHAKKRKGFWSNTFGRSSNATNTNEKQDEQEPKRKGFMNSLMTNARQAATKEVVHLAEEEAMKEVKAEWDNNDGSQPTDTTTTTANAAPDTSTSSDDVLSAPTNWAKRMVDNVQQKVQGLQNLAT